MRAHVNITTEIKVKLITMTIAALIIAALANPAEAKRHHKHHHAKLVRIATITPYVRCDDRYPNCGVQPVVKTTNQTRIAQDDSERIVGHPAGCPWRQFCGCGSCAEVGISPAECKRKGLFLAANWLKFPRASPGPGMAAARYGHVMIIRSIDANGNATVYNPNSGGHLTRIMIVSLRGYHIVNPNGNIVAMR